MLQQISVKSIQVDSVIGLRQMIQFSSSGKICSDSIFLTGFSGHLLASFPGGDKISPKILVLTGYHGTAMDSSDDTEPDMDATDGDVLKIVHVLKLLR